MSEPDQKQVPLWLKIFLGFHCLIIFSWSLPKAPPAMMDGAVELSPVNFFTNFADWILVANEKVKRKTFQVPGFAPGINIHRDYLLRTGLWQYWDMFAPNPADTDVYLEAKITYKDGTTAIQPYPRMFTKPIYEKYFKERFRKFTERLHPDSYAWKWPTFAQRMALDAYHDKNNPPLNVVLIRHWKQLQPMTEPQWTNYRVNEFYEYKVDLKRLQEDKPL